MSKYITADEYEKYDKFIKDEPCEDAISRQIISDYVESHIQEINTGYGDLNQHTNKILRMIVDYIESMPSVTPSNRGWEEMTVSCENCGHDMTFKIAVCGEQEPCEDAISREELLKAIETWDKFGCDADTKLVPYKDHYIPYIHYDDVIKAIKGMPSVTPSRPTEHKPICDDCIYFDNGKGSEKCDSCELTGTNKPSRRKGHWKRVSIDKYSEHAHYWYECDKCGKQHLGNTNYCPICGAEMESEG